MMITAREFRLSSIHSFIEKLQWIETIAVSIVVVVSLGHRAQHTPLTSVNSIVAVRGYRSRGVTLSMVGNSDRGIELKGGDMVKWRPQRFQRKSSLEGELRRDTRPLVMDLLTY